jgi:hypothetical protein
MLKTEKAEHELVMVQKTAERKINLLERKLHDLNDAKASEEHIISAQQRQVDLDAREVSKQRRQLAMDQSSVEQQLLLCRQDAERLRSRTDSIREERVQMKEFRSNGQKIIDQAVHNTAEKVETTTKVQSHIFFISTLVSFVNVFACLVFATTCCTAATFKEVSESISEAIEKETRPVGKN